MPKREREEDLFVPDNYDDDDDEFVDELSDSEDEKPERSDKMLLKGALTPPRHITLSAKQIHDMIHYGEVDLNPAYQRDVVWSDAKQMHLIQSIFLNYYIPPIIFSVKYDEIGGQQLTCIDGKQRCTSILNFIDGTIPFISPATKERYWFSKFGQQKRGQQLPDFLKRRFEQVSMQVVEYNNLAEEQQRDIFQRVQLGVALSSAEKMQAIPSPWSTWIIQLQKKYVAEPNTLGDKITMDTTRAKAFQHLTSFVILAYEYPVKEPIPTANTCTTFLQRADQPDQNFKRKVEMALSLFVDIATNYYKAAFGTTDKRVAPVEFWFTALFIFSRMGMMSITSLASKIGEMRDYIRIERGHFDVRANGRVVKEFYSWLNAQPKRRDRTEIPAAEEYEGDDVDMRDQRAAKRARQQEERDPTYRDAGIERGIESGLSGTRNSKAQAAAAPSTVDRNPTLTRPPVPAPPAVRPNRNAMDGAGLPNVSNNFGASAALPAPNPYQNQDYGQQNQRYTAPNGGPTYTAQQWQAMAQAQAQTQAAQQMQAQARGYQR